MVPGQHALTSVNFYQQPNQKVLNARIWMGKILADAIQLAKFAKVSLARVTVNSISLVMNYIAIYNKS